MVLYTTEVELSIIVRFWFSAPVPILGREEKKMDEKVDASVSEIGSANACFVWLADWTIFTCTNNQFWRKLFANQIENSVFGGHCLNRVWTFHVWGRIGTKCREMEGCCERISSLGCDLDDLELVFLPRIYRSRWTTHLAVVCMSFRQRWDKIGAFWDGYLQECSWECILVFRANVLNSIVRVFLF